MTKAEEIRIKRLRELEKKGYVIDKNSRLLHREIYRKAYGFIPKDWIIRHVDKNKNNNNLENLVAIPIDLNRNLRFIEKENKIAFNADQLKDVVKNHIRTTSSDYR